MNIHVNRLVLKKSSVHNRRPTTADLVYGELAINYVDGKLYTKIKRSDQDEIIELNRSDISTYVDRKSFRAQGGETNISVLYSGNNVDVFKNGVKLVEGTDYFLESSGTQIIFATPLDSGDYIDIIGFKSGSINALVEINGGTF